MPTKVQMNTYDILSAHKALLHNTVLPKSKTSALIKNAVFKNAVKSP